MIAFAAFILLVLTMPWALGRAGDFSAGRRSTLLLLRSSAILLLLALANGCDPLAALLRPAPHRVAFVLDNSQSMGLCDGTRETRRQTADRLARRLADRSGIDGSFGSLTTAPAGRDSLRDPVPWTDLAGGIAGAARGRPDAIVLLSDGGHNRGGSPVLAAAGSGVPVFTVGIGPVSATGTAAISDLTSPDRVGSGEPFTVTVSLSGVSGPALLVLSDQGRTIARQQVRPGAAAADLRAAAGSPGLHRCQVLLTRDGAVLDRRVFPVMVEQRKLAVAWIGGALDWNLRFFAQALAADPGIELLVFVRRNGRWSDLRGAALSLDSAARCDLAVIEGLDAERPDGQVARLIDQLLARGKGVLVLGEAGPAVSPRMPLRPAGQRQPVSGPVVLTDGWRRSALFPASDTAAAELLRRGPSCEIAGRYQPNDSATVVLASARAPDQTLVPCWAWEFSGTARVMQFALTDLWKWKLALAGAFRDTVFYDQLIGSTVRWLAGAQQGSFRLAPERGIAFDNEPVAFRGTWQGWGEGAAAGLRWTVFLSGPGGSRRTAVLADWGHGAYAADAGVLPAGTYAYHGRVALGGKLLDQQQGAVFVEPGIDEARDLTQNRGLLAEIAAVSGGSYIGADSLDPGKPWPVSWPPAQRPRQDGGSLPLLALLAIALLSAEWLLRRRHGLR